MIKRTIIAITISIAGWAILQIAIPEKTADSHDSLFSSVSLVIGSAPSMDSVHAQEEESPVRQSRFTTGILTRTLSAKLAQTLTDTTPITFTAVLTAADSLNAETPSDEEVDDSELGDTELADTEPADAESDDRGLDVVDVGESDSAETESPTSEETSQPAEATVEPADDALPPGQTDLSEDNPVLGIVDGTILANRTDMTIKFFVEGQIYEVATLRSIGLDLPRSSTVLNLYNCDTSIPETEETCYWDPYMVDRFGFYDIVVEDGISGIAKVTLSEAGGPSGAAIWIQNKSPQAEIIVYRNVIFDLLPGALREFAVGDDALPTFFVRSCLEVDGDSACEWVPIVATVGLRYALIETRQSGGLPNSRVSMLDLLPLDENGEVIVCS
jgi:hypothetical protein